MSKHRLSLTVAAGAPVTLRIDLKAVGAAQNGYATWSTFGVGSEASKYSLSVTGFADGASPIGDGLAYHDGQPFSTRDRDYAADLGSNCPVTYPGAWWFLHCFYSNLNGVYRPNGINAGYAQGIEWDSYRDFNDGAVPYQSLIFSEMKLR